MVKILIVEDEPDGAEVVEMILAPANYQTIVVPNAEAALEYLNRQHNFDALILDLALPNIDGLELFEMIKENPSIIGIPVIAITAFHTPELKAQCLDAGFDGYFPKPLDITNFLDDFQYIISQKQ